MAESSLRYSATSCLFAEVYPYWTNNISGAIASALIRRPLEARPFWGVASYWPCSVGCGILYFLGNMIALCILQSNKVFLGPSPGKRCCIENISYRISFGDYVANNRGLSSAN